MSSYFELDVQYAPAVHSFYFKNSNYLKLRHPSGSDAHPFIDWRASLSDEESVNWNCLNDDDWYEAVQNTFGLNDK